MLGPTHRAPLVIAELRSRLDEPPPSFAGFEYKIDIPGARDLVSRMLYASLYRAECFCPEEDVGNRSCGVQN